MRWYEGGIADAVVLTKKKSAIFVVFIEGKDDKSKQLTQLLEDQTVCGKLETETFVAIKIEANSVPHQQFAQLYKQATVPSIFFIGKTGAPIGIITEPLTSEEFQRKINGIIEEHTGKSVMATESLIKSEQASSSSNVVCENGVCRRVEKEPSPSTSSSQDESTEAKVERAKELIEKKREEKEQEEKEKERLSEIERRKLGQDVQKLKRWQEDQQLKNMLEEREREKRAEQAARERVLAQIAQDKAERAARFSGSSPPAPTTQTTPVQRPVPTNSNRARLQFRLPDGSSHTHEFASDEPLETVRSYIRANLNLTFGNYVLSTAFPRREFTDNNNAETLADLGLAPNAVVLVLPAQQRAVARSDGGFIRGLFWSMVAPFLSFFGYLKIFLFGTGREEVATTREPERAAPDVTQASTSRPTWRRRMGDTTVIKRHGNIHRLSDGTDSDDENLTWNGNSTQQM